MNTDLHLSLHELREKLAEVQEKVSALQLELPEIMHAMNAVEYGMPSPDSEAFGNGAHSTDADGKRELSQDASPISMTQAGRRYGIAMTTVRRWVQKGLVRIIDPGIGKSGSRILVDENDVATLAMSSSSEQLEEESKATAAIDRNENRSKGVHTLPAKGTPITMTKAARLYRVSRQTLYTWKRQGHIAIIGPKTGRGGSGVLVDERDVAELVSNKKPRGAQMT